jgi:hypothetical protein
MPPFSARLIIGIVTVITMALTAPTAHAWQHQNGNVYQNWSNPSSGWNTSIEQRITPDRIHPYSFFTLGGGLDNARGGFYIGLLQDGSSAWNRKMRFSVWNATAAWPDPNSQCRTFGGEGSGYTCERSFGYVEGRSYIVRLRLINSSDPNGLWWAGEVVDLSARITYSMGAIRAPKGAGFVNSPYSFVEYYGPSIFCSKLPLMRATFTNPLFNGGRTSGYARTSIGSCSLGAVMRVTGGSRLSLGS